MRSHNPPPLRCPVFSLALVPFSNQCGTSQSTFLKPNVLASTPPRVHLFRGSASSLSHRPVSTSDIICNNQSPPLEDIVLFGLFLSGFPSRFLKRFARERFPHPYEECFVLLPNRYGISQSTPIRSPASSLALVPFSNQCGTPQSSPLQNPASLVAHRLVSTPFRSQPPR